MAQESGQLVPPKRLNATYPVIDTDPHWRRAFRYARGEDWTYGAGMAAIGPAFLTVTERYAPSFSGRGAYPPLFRLSVAVGLVAGAGLVYQRSCLRFLGASENQREIDLDMREMVDKVKKGEPLYGTSTLSPYMQGVAARNSRFSSLLSHVVPFANFVNHNQHGVDTAKYYQQAERELEAEKGT
ncbi:uncharacterized protein HMPREF1541_01176 [Cyphellophora europaea CBS 101466]|uniref:NADH-ubiquinone oxidoreductase 21 kDa subunit n=1 Tax=Cyphellophora europaea (strain CBS 101466) TaxID=1220924 RepID=W2SE36_CYPE1|nr:uncharacterized protein HMPREF1541_01176 [Cyphellophora europaea CBS 101466]ETN46986.1 hypothetical protein HMPREF1541_01176 [Cyphellophora europaea CBS 101466]